MEHYRAMIQVTFVGAGSIEFTRNVVTDLCSYPEFRGQLHLSLHDITPTGWPTPSGWPGGSARSPARTRW